MIIIIIVIIIIIIIIILLEFWLETLAVLMIIITTMIKKKTKTKITELTLKSYLQLISLKIIRWFCTAHSKMATVKEIIWKNIIKMKLTEEKSCWDFPLRLFLAKIRLNVFNWHNAVRVLVSSTSSRRTSMVDVKLVLTHFYFYLNAIFITLRPNRDTQYKFCKKGFF